MSTRAVKSSDDFNGELAAANIRGQWLLDPMLEHMAKGPPPEGVPFIWRWADLEPRLREACEVLPDSMAQRNLTLVNPGSERGGTTGTLGAGVQIVKPGETFSTHRHTMATVRFVVKGGPGMVTVVDGESFPMEDFDLIVLPSQSWHDHDSGAADPGIWMDTIDIGVVMGLNVPLYEVYGEERQPVREHVGDSSARRAGVEQRKLVNAPYRYSWKEVEPFLTDLASASDGSPYDGVAVEYVNPVTGGPTLPTLSCRIQLLKPGQTTQSRRHSASACYFVIRGEGTTVVSGEELDWAERDVFCVPNWMQHHFANRSRNEDAVLYSVTDIPALRAVGLYLEEPENAGVTTPWPSVPANQR
jgi:1-hydroxy-2-naphthoate dioxygenase